MVGYGAAFYLVSLTLEGPIGVVFGTWAALGVVGVYCLNVVSEMAAH